VLFAKLFGVHDVLLPFNVQLNVFAIIKEFAGGVQKHKRANCYTPVVGFAVGHFPTAAPVPCAVYFFDSEHFVLLCGMYN
jgi:uncharacterized membrane protein